MIIIFISSVEQTKVEKNINITTPIFHCYIRVEINCCYFIYSPRKVQTYTIRLVNYKL